MDKVLSVTFSVTPEEMDVLINAFGTPNPDDGLGDIVRSLLMARAASEMRRKIDAATFSRRIRDERRKPTPKPHRPKTVYPNDHVIARNHAVTVSPHDELPQGE